MKKRILVLILLVCMLCSSLMTGCTNNGNGNTETTSEDSLWFQDAEAAMEYVNTQELNIIDDNYRNYYEIFPYSFCDSDGDGIGDIQGIISKLDYISELGINGLWLTPVHQSNSYHKYDVIDYYSIDPSFGTIEDYEELLDECHKRGINVIMDLVVNHSSSSHAWFYEATRYLRTLEEGQEPSVEDCKYVDYYVFSKEKKSGFSKVAGTDWYYECQFVDNMPDLNLDSELVKAEIDQIVQFWLDKGVDGFRLDAVTSYYTGSNEKNIEFLTWLNTCVKEKKPDAYIVGECWTNSVTYASYYESGVDSFFNFDFATNSGAICSALNGGSALTYGNKIVSVAELIEENNPNYIDAGFTSNHDNARAAGTLPGDSAKLKVAQAMAMMIGGSYYLYYGDEVGMKGAGDDQNKRAPMQWSENALAKGMCKSIATKEIEMVNGSVETQSTDGDSLLNYVKQALKLRNTYPEIARGETYVITECSNEDVVVLKKVYEGSEILIVMNLSENANTVDLSGVSINGKDAGTFEVGGTLLATSELVEVDGSTLNMPAYSIEILK